MPSFSFQRKHKPEPEENLCVNLCAHVHSCTFFCACACRHAFMYRRLCTYMCACVGLHLFTFLCVRLCTCVWVRVHVGVCVIVCVLFLRTVSVRRDSGAMTVV